MKNNNINPDFNDYLQRLRSARNRTDQLLTIHNPGHEMAETSLACSWDALFSHFVNNPDDLDLSNINAISSIIHKLTSSYTQIKNLEIKTSEHFQKSEEHFHKIQHLTKALEKNSPQNGLTKDQINEIQSQLDLL